MYDENIRDRCNFESCRTVKNEVESIPNRIFDLICANEASYASIHIQHSFSATCIIITGLTLKNDAEERKHRSLQKPCLRRCLIISRVITFIAAIFSLFSHFQYFGAS